MKEYINRYEKATLECEQSDGEKMGNVRDRLSFISKARLAVRGFKESNLDEKEAPRYSL